MLRALLSNGMPVPPGFATLRAHQGQQSALRRDVCLHEIEHDGFRVSAWKDGNRVKVCRPRNDLPTDFRFSRPGPACRHGPASATARRAGHGNVVHALNGRFKPRFSGDNLSSNSVLLSRGRSFRFVVVHHCVLVEQL
jgi:hypothetical protein